MLKTLHLDYEKPTCILFNTIKGYGIDIIEKNPIEWHYKTLTYNNYINILKTLKYASSNR
jgi:pyruvate dehydrogenase complex dehydrogenase (E1) component